ncbi:MAG: GNAT family N-acetyltransferase [Rhodocyclaceae bacterium]|nr:GNAT family N-acetyltransferase [Rhodocyclaceae bacterium]
MTLAKKGGIAIRGARHEDFDRFMVLARAMHEESRFRRYPINEAKVKELFGLHIDKAAAYCVLLAERADGQLVGMLGGLVTDFFFSDARVAQDRVFFVLPEARGTSAAVRLLAAFRRWAENRQVDELEINMSVAVDMPRFNRLMTHLGFACCGSNFHLYLQKK